MLKIIKKTKFDTLVIIIGHKDPHFLIDTADSIYYYNSGNYRIVFAIDFDEHTSSVLAKNYDNDSVFVTKEKNGWGRGILRTIIHALDYFGSKFRYNDVITIDSDALCTGPFIETMVKSVKSQEIFFVGTTWYSPPKDHDYHFTLRNSGFLPEYNFNFRTEMAAGPCMLWSRHCLKFLEKIELVPGCSFDRYYPNILFAHDQLSTYLISCGIGAIADVGSIMEIKWRESLPVIQLPGWGLVPSIHDNISIIHPTQSNFYSEESCRKYFRNKRAVTKLKIS